MTSDQPLAEHREPGHREPGPEHAELEEVTESGGDPACWACLVCEECGAVVSEGHSKRCSQHASSPADDR